MDVKKPVRNEKKIDFEPIFYVIKNMRRRTKARRDEKFSIIFMSYTEKNFPSMSKKTKSSGV